MEVVKIYTGKYPEPTPGSAGLNTQVAGGICSVSNLSNSSGGIIPGGLVESDLG